MKEETHEAIRKVLLLCIEGVFPTVVLIFSASIAYMASGVALNFGFEKEALAAFLLGISLNIVLILYHSLFDEAYELRKKNGGW